MFVWWILQAQGLPETTPWPKPLTKETDAMMIRCKEPGALPRFGKGDEGGRLLKEIGALRN